MKLKPNDVLYNIISGKLIIVKEVDTKDEYCCITSKEGNMELLPIQFINENYKRLYTEEDLKGILTSILSNLAAFNKLDITTIKLIQETIELNIIDLCKDAGITFVT